MNMKTARTRQHAARHDSVRCILMLHKADSTGQSGKCLQSISDFTVCHAKLTISGDTYRQPELFPVDCTFKKDAQP